MIGKADRAHPADGVLRMELKRAKGVSREQGGPVSKAVFAYYRWRGWLDETDSIDLQISRATELNEAFQKHPTDMDEEELRRAVPDWVFGQMDASLEWLRILQTEPVLWLRVRPGRSAELIKKLGRAHPAALPDSLGYDGKEDLFRRPEFHAGDFELQDLSSQAVGFVCNPQPGETWWDACAGEGGKTLHLAELMRGKGLVWATDRADWRLQTLKRRTARAKIYNYRAALWDGTATLPSPTKFDGILVDAPCSGLGTWRRNPHARWTTGLEDVAELSVIQKQLLTNAAPALKPGARLIYSACSLTRAETTEVQKAVTKQCPELEPFPLLNPFDPAAPAAESLWLWPQTFAGNGMFICAWRRR